LVFTRQDAQGRLLRLTLTDNQQQEFPLPVRRLGASVPFQAYADPMKAKVKDDGTIEVEPFYVTRVRCEFAPGVVPIDLEDRSPSDDEVHLAGASLLHKLTQEIYLDERQVHLVIVPGWWALAPTSQDDSVLTVGGGQCASAARNVGQRLQQGDITDLAFSLTYDATNAAGLTRFREALARHRPPEREYGFPLPVFHPLGRGHGWVARTADGLAIPEMADDVLAHELYHAAFGFTGESGELVAWDEVAAREFGNHYRRQKGHPRLADTDPLREGQGRPPLIQPWEEARMGDLAFSGGWGPGAWPHKEPPWVTGGEDGGPLEEWNLCWWWEQCPSETRVEELREDLQSRGVPSSVLDLFPQ